MEADKAPHSAVFSADGYAVNQTRAQPLPYGHFGSHLNGCGWMAAYNILRALGKSVQADEVRTELARGLWFGGRLGTGPLRLARYLRAQGVRVRLTLRRKMAYARAQECRAGAVLYWNGCQSGAHYAAFAPGHAATERCTQVRQGHAGPHKSRASEKSGEREKCGTHLPTHAFSTAQSMPPRAMRFFNARQGEQNHTQTLPDFCAQVCKHKPALFFTVE